MLKYLFVVLAGSLICRDADAQKTDSASYYINAFKSKARDGEIVTDKDKADFLLTIYFPADSSTGVKINAVKETSLDNKIELIGTAIINLFGSQIVLSFTGPRTEYYPNGQKQVIKDYKNNKVYGDVVNYYPDGKLYAKEKYRLDNKFYLIECHSSDGKTLAANGNGSWVKYDEGYKHKIEAGTIKDSLEEGEWQGMINDSATYTRMYHKGELLPTRDTTGQVFIAADREPEFIGGSKAFNDFYYKTIRYPSYAKINHIQGKVYLSFIVEKDGGLTNFKILKGPDASLNDEAIRVIKLSSPWVPGILNNKPVRTAYTIPLSFVLGTN